MFRLSLPPSTHLVAPIAVPLLHGCFFVSNTVAKEGCFVAHVKTERGQKGGLFDSWVSWHRGIVVRCYGDIKNGFTCVLVYIPAAVPSVDRPSQVKEGSADPPEALA